MSLFFLWSLPPAAAAPPAYARLDDGTYPLLNAQQPETTLFQITYSGAY